MNRNTYKWGIGLLKMLLCFCVILIHYGQASEITQKFNAIMSSAVPCFMLITFYFNSKTLLEGNKYKIKDRVLRLMVPCVSWGIIYFIVYKLLYLLKIRNVNLSWNNLLWQLITGHSYNAPLWYMYDLIVLTIIFTLMFKVFKKKSNLMLAILLVFSMLYLYSGINGIFNELRGELRWPLGRFAEMIPYACIGLLIGTNRERFLKMNWKYRFLNLILLFIMWLAVFKIENQGILLIQYNYGYAGLGLLLKSVFIFLAALFVSDISVNKCIENLIIKASQYTLGIYCMHVLIGECFLAVFNIYEIHIDEFIMCILILGVSYLFSIGIDKIPIKKSGNIVC